MNNVSFVSSSTFSNQGNLPVTYIRSVLDIYEDVLQQSANNSDHVTGKVKQEILHGLGTDSIPHLIYIPFDA